MIKYGFVKKLQLDIDSTLKRVEESLNKEGFGIVSKIDMSEKFKEKLDIDFKRYYILGACSPKDAYHAVIAEENIGLLLPCNVIVYDNDKGTTVSIIKPTVAMASVENSDLEKIAPPIEDRLKRVIDSL